MTEVDYSNLQVNDFQTKELVGDYLDAYGAFRTLDSCDHIFSWLSLYGQEKSINQNVQKSLDSAKNLFFRGKCTLVIPKFYGSTKGMVESFSKDTRNVIQKGAGFLCDCTRTIGLVGFIDGIKLTPLTSKILGSSSEIFSITQDSADLIGNVKKYSNLRSDQKEIGQINSKANAYLSENKKMILLKVVELVSAIAASAFIAIALFMGLSLASSMLLLSLSTTTLVTAVWGGFYEKTMTYKPLPEEIV